MTATKIPTRSKRYQLVTNVRDVLIKEHNHRYEVRIEKNQSYFMIQEQDFFPKMKMQSKSKYAGQRVGYRIDPGTSVTSVGITTEYNEAALDNFKRNFDAKIFSSVTDGLLKLSSTKHIYIDWSSKNALIDAKARGKTSLKGDDLRTYFSFKSTQDFQTKLAAYGTSDFIKDVGCNPPTSGAQEDRVPIRGKSFSIEVVVPTELTIKAAKCLYPLYSWLFSFKKTRNRNSDLRRKLVSFYEMNDKAFVCAFRNCKTKHIERLIAAHIIPDQKYGTDHPTNGIFLCSEHHLKQEGQTPEWQRKFLKSSARKGTILE